MRELKFRAWSEETRTLYSSDDIREFPLEVVKNGNVWTFEQYTGLKDKNGKEIYEGDIVRWSYKVDRNAEPIHTTDKVEWGTYEEEEWPYSTISGFTLPESEDGYEVIGNIHENPELLGEEEE